MFESDDLEYHKGKYYGLYRAYVYDNKDPEDLGRLKLCIPDVYGDEDGTPCVSDWIPPMFPVGGWQFGLQCIPPVKNPDGTNVLVWVIFEMGDKEYPVWLGSPIHEKGLQKDVLRNHRAKVGGITSKVLYCWSTPNGHKIYMDDQKETENECLVIQTAKGHKIIFDDKKTRKNAIKIETVDGHQILFDDENDKIKATVEDKYIEIDAKKGITIKGDVKIIGKTSVTKDVVGGTDSKAVSLLSHTHTGVHGGTTPPN